MIAIRSLVLSLAVVAMVLAGPSCAEDPSATFAVKVAAGSQLNSATALANKNSVMTAQNAAVTRSNIRAQQDDVVSVPMDEQAPTMDARGTNDDDGAQPKDVPAGLVLTGDRDVLQRGTEQDEAHDIDAGDDETGELATAGDKPPSDLTLTGERDVLKSPDAAKDADDNDEAAEEQFVGYRRRFFYPGFRGGYYGWRYPLPYWRRYGRRFYGGRCAFGRIYGGYYYC